MPQPLMRRGFLLPTAVLLSLGWVAGCSIVGPEADELVLLNRSDRPLVYLALELETSHLVDPNPRFPVGPDHDRLLAPGDSVVLTAENVSGGYRTGDDVRFFLYTLQDGEAVYRGSLTLMHEQLELLHFRVEIQQL